MVKINDSLTTHLRYAWVPFWLLSITIAVALSIADAAGLPTFGYDVIRYGFILVLALSIRTAVTGEPEVSARIKKSLLYGTLLIVIVEIILETALTLKGRMPEESYAATVIISLFYFDLPTLFVAAIVVSIPIRLLGDFKNLSGSKDLS